MMETMQTLFGLTVSVTDFPLAPEQARALTERVTAAAMSVRDGAPAALAADVRRDAERYLALRRTRALRLPAGLERECDEGARAVMRLTVNAPPMLVRSERLVA